MVIVRQDLGEFIPHGFQCATKVGTESRANLFGEKSTTPSYLCFTTLPGSAITGISVCHPSGSDEADRISAKVLYKTLANLYVPTMKKGSKNKNRPRRGTEIPNRRANPLSDELGLPAKQLDSKFKERMVEDCRSRASSVAGGNSPCILENAGALSVESDSQQRKSRHQSSLEADIVASGVSILDSMRGNDNIGEVVPCGWTSLSSTLYGYSASFPRGRKRSCYLAIRKSTSHVKLMRNTASKNTIINLLSLSKPARKSVDDSVLDNALTQRSNSEQAALGEPLQSPKTDVYIPASFTPLLPLHVQTENLSQHRMNHKAFITPEYSPEGILTGFSLDVKENALKCTRNTLYATLSGGATNQDVIKSISEVWLNRSQNRRRETQQKGSETPLSPSETTTVSGHSEEDDNDREDIAATREDSERTNISPSQVSWRMDGDVVGDDPLLHLRSLQWISSGFSAFLEIPPPEILMSSRRGVFSLDDMEDKMCKPSWSSSPLASCLSPLLTALYSHKKELLHLAMASLTNILECDFFGERKEGKYGTHSSDNARIIVEYIVAILSDASRSVMNEIHEFIGTFSEIIIAKNVSSGTAGFYGLSSLTWYRLLGLHFSAINFCNQKHRALRSTLDASGHTFDTSFTQQLQVEEIAARRSKETSWRAAYKFIETFLSSLQGHLLYRDELDFHGSSCHLTNALAATFWNHSSSSALFALDIHMTCTKFWENAHTISDAWIFADMAPVAENGDDVSYPDSERRRRSWIQNLRKLAIPSPSADLVVVIGLICRSISPRGLGTVAGAPRLTQADLESRAERLQRASLIMSLRTGLLFLKKLLELLSKNEAWKRSSLLISCIKAFMIPSLLNLGNSMFVCDCNLFLPTLECVKLLWLGFRAVIPSQLSPLIQTFIQTPLLCRGTSRAVTFRKVEVLQSLMEWFYLPHELLQFYTLLDLHAGAPIASTLDTAHDRDLSFPPMMRGTVNIFGRCLTMIVRSIAFSVAGYSDMSWTSILAFSKQESDSSADSNSKSSLCKDHTVRFRREGLGFLRMVSRTLMDSAATAFYASFSEPELTGINPASSHNRSPGVTSNASPSERQPLSGVVSPGSITSAVASPNGSTAGFRSISHRHSGSSPVARGRLQASPASISKSTRFLRFFKPQHNTESRASQGALNLVSDDIPTGEETDCPLRRMDPVFASQVWVRVAYQCLQEFFVPILKDSTSGTKALERLIRAGSISPADPFSQTEVLKSMVMCWNLADIGQILSARGSKGHEHNMSTVESPESGRRLLWMLGLDVRNRPFLESVRHFLTEGGFMLPGEGQQIERIAEAFAWAYYVQNSRFLPQHCSDEGKPCSLTDNEGRLWPSNQDVCFLLVYSIIMVNTQVHNPAAHTAPHMSLDVFWSMLRTSDNGHPLPKEFLEPIYNGIVNEGIQLEGFEDPVVNDVDELDVLGSIGRPAPSIVAAQKQEHPTEDSLSQVAGFVNTSGINPRYFSALLKDMNTIASSMQSLLRISVFVDDPASEASAGNTISDLTYFLKKNATTLQRLNKGLQSELSGEPCDRDDPIINSVRKRACNIVYKMTKDSVIEFDEEENKEHVDASNEASSSPSPGNTTDSAFGVSSILLLFRDVLPPLTIMLREILNSVRDNAAGSFISRVEFHVDLSTVSEALDIMHHLLCTAVVLRQEQETIEILNIFSEAEKSIWTEEKDIKKSSVNFRGSSTMFSVEDLRETVHHIFPNAVQGSKSKGFALHRKKKKENEPSREHNFGDAASEVIRISHAVSRTMRDHFARKWDVQDFIRTVTQFETETHTLLQRSSSRRIIYAGPVIKACKSGRGKLRKYNMWLFSDVLLYGTKNVLGSKYHPHGVFHLDDMHMEENPKELKDRKINVSFALHGGKKELYFFCENPEETIAWRRNIHEALRERSNRKAPPSKK